MSNKKWWVEVESDYTNVESESETIAAEVANEHAHLIAAAPELYEALSDAVDDLEQVFKICHGYVDANDLARYRNALAKARGEHG